MQFTRTERAGSNTATIEFFGLHKLNQRVQNILNEYFNHLGGKVINNKGDYEFPLHITSQTIQEIIKNTCFVCGGLMQDGQALENTWVGSEDFGGDYGHTGTTMSKVGQPIMRIVRKCSSCGHSHT